MLLPAPKPPGRLIILPTRDIVHWLRESLSRMSDVSYNLNEIGAVLVEALDIAMLGGPDRVAEMRHGFSDHFARMLSHQDGEYDYAYQRFDEFFGDIAARMHSVDLESLGKNGHLGITFHQWTGEDLVVHHHPLPY